MIGSECTLEPTPFPMSSVLSRVLIPDGKKCVSSVNGNLAKTGLSQGGMFVSGNKRDNEVDINHFHVFFAHAHLSVLRGPHAFGPKKNILGTKY